MAVNIWHLLATEPDEDVCDCLACCSMMKLWGKIASMHRCIPRGTILSEKFSFVALKLSTLLLTYIITIIEAQQMNVLSKKVVP